MTYFCPGHLNKVKDGKGDFSNKAITYLSFSPDGTELLVNMGAEQIYLFDVFNAKVPVVSVGRRGCGWVCIFNARCKTLFLVSYSI